MTRSTLVSLALAAGLLIAPHTGNARSAIVAPSLAVHSFVQNVGDVEYCYWKQKKNGRWKLECDD
jgi:hypothetical protein